MTGIRKVMRVPQRFVFFRRQLPSFCIWRKFRVQWEAWPLRRPHTLRHRRTLHVASYQTTARCVLWNAVPLGHRALLCAGAVAKDSGRLVCTSSAHRYAPVSHQSSLIKPRFKTKMLKNFKMATAGQVSCSWSWLRRRLLPSFPRAVSSSRGLLIVPPKCQACGLWTHSHFMLLLTVLHSGIYMACLLTASCFVLRWHLLSDPFLDHLKYPI